MCKRLVSILSGTLTALLVAAGTLNAHQIDDVIGQGKAVFVIVEEPGAAGLPGVRINTQKAANMVGDVEIIELDRKDPQNAEFVKERRLATAPVPLVLVFASNGALGGGLPGAKALPNSLVSLVPSPKKAEALLALQSGKSVFITATRAGMSESEQVFDCCAEAGEKIKGGCVSINIDLDDAAETVFLSQLKINPQSTTPQTVVINAQGQITGSFDGPVDVTQLVQAATKRVSSGCCPPGSGKSCGPTPPKGGK